jgi:hypothetical protein
MLHTTHYSVNDDDDDDDDDDDNTLLWNQTLHPDREVTGNRRDIIIKNKKEKTCTLIGVAIPLDRNVVQKGSGKEVKYNC